MLYLRIFFANLIVISGDSTTHDATWLICHAALDGTSGRDTVTILNVRRRPCFVKMPTLNVLFKTPQPHSNAGVTASLRHGAGTLVPPLA